MARFLKCVGLVLLLACAGCGDDEATPPVATPAVQNNAAAPAAPAPAAAAPAAPAAPVAVPVAASPQPPLVQPPLAQPTPLVQPPAGSNPNAAAASGDAAVVYVPFGPLLIPLTPIAPVNPPGYPPGNAGPNMLAGALPPWLVPPGAVPGQPGLAGLPPGVAPPGGLPPGMAPPVLSPPGVGGSAVPRAPQTDLEKYNGPELFAVTPDGALLVTFAIDASRRPAKYELKLWNLRNGREAGQLESNDNISAMSVSPDGSLLATVAGNGEGAKLTLWELPTGSKRTSHDWSKFGTVSFTHDSKRIVTPAGKQAVAIVDLESGKAKTRRVKTMAETLAVAASPTQPYMAIGMGEKKRTEAKSTPGAAAPAGGAPTPKELEELRQKVAAARQQAQSGGGRRRGKKKGGGKSANHQADPNEALGLEHDAEGVVQIVDLETGKIKHRLYVTGAPTDLVFNTDGSVLAAFMAGGAGTTWDCDGWAEGGRLGRTVLPGGNFNPPPPVNGGEAKGTFEPMLLAISPGAEWAVSRQSPSTRAPAELWDTKLGTNRVIDPLAASQMGFLPDGTVVLAIRDLPIRFFDPKTLTLVYPPFGK